MGGPGREGFRKVCCLLRDLGPGGANWHWVRLLAEHVERGGEATIFAQPGPLAEVARGRGIAASPVSWGEGGAHDQIWRTVAEQDVTIVQWELGPMELFARTLDECGCAALAVHGAPQAMSRAFAPPAPMRLRRTVELAADDPRAQALVCGAAHRRKVADAYGVPEDALQVLPPFAPLGELRFRLAAEEPLQVLAMTRLGPEKMAIVRLAVELVRERAHECRLTVAGDGPRRAEAIELCERRLPPGSWRIEPAPADPIARLADSDLVVAQGMTTLEAAALGRRLVVARSFGAREASGAVLTPDNYDEAARDPFGRPQASEDVSALWSAALDVGERQLMALRHLVERHNSPTVALRSFDNALATGPNSWSSPQIRQDPPKRVESGEAQNYPGRRLIP